MAQLIALLGDITTQSVNVIVNAANNQLEGGGGVDGAIHRAGGPMIMAECSRWIAANGPLPTGEAMSTTAGDLPAQHVVHTVGPVWGKTDARSSDRLLESAYRKSLDLARGLGAATIAFPNISTGVYGYPKRRAAMVAIDAVRIWAETERGILDEVRFVCFDEENHQIYKDCLGDPGVAF